MKAAVGELSTTTEERAFLKVHFLPEGIKSLALSPNGRSIFYIIGSQSAGGAIGIAANRDGSSPRTLFTSKLSHWHAAWPGASTIFVSSAWSLDGGIVYQINTQNDSVRTLYTTSGAFAGISGGPRGEMLVTDFSTGYISSLAANGSLDPTIAFSWPSLCSFASGASSTAVCADIPQSGIRLFEAWSRGEYDLASSIAVFDFSTGIFRFVLTEQERLDRLFDVVKPTISPNSDYVTFVNRVDGMLWGIVAGIR